MGVETFTLTRAARIHFLDPVKMLFVVLHAVHAVKWKRAEQSIAGDGAAHPRDCRSIFVTQKMPPKTGLGALGILEFDDPHPLDRFLAHSEKTGCDLRNHVVIIRDEAVGIPAFAGAAEGVPGCGGAGLGKNGMDADRPEAHPPAIDGNIDMDLRPAIPALIQIKPGVDIGNLIVWSLVTGDCVGLLVSTDPGSSNLNRIRSNPPPEAPCLYSRCGGGVWPVSASCHVDRIKSPDQRGSPRQSTLGLSRNTSAFWGH